MNYNEDNDPNYDPDYSPDDEHPSPNTIKANVKSLNTVLVVMGGTFTLLSIINFFLMIKYKGVEGKKAK